MKRIMVIGCPGSGKSTFARSLRDKLDLPLHYMDMLFWRPDKTNISGDELIEKLNKIVVEDKWIIDGNYGSSLELRLKYADTVFFLDYPTKLCLDSIRKRRGSVTPDMPWVESVENPNLEFEEFVKNFENEYRNEILDLLNKYNYLNIIVFHTRDEANEFLDNIKGA